MMNSLSIIGLVRSMISWEKSQSAIRSREIDELLGSDCMDMNREIKILVLGSYGSGKSTIIKMMEMYSDIGFSYDYRKSWRGDVFNSMIYDMKSILGKMEFLGIDMEHQHNQIHKERLNQQPLLHKNSQMSQEMITTMDALWNDPGMHDCYQRFAGSSLSGSSA